MRAGGGHTGPRARLVESVLELFERTCKRAAEQKNHSAGTGDFSRRSLSRRAIKYARYESSPAQSWRFQTPGRESVDGSRPKAPMSIPYPTLLFLGNGDDVTAKTAHGIRYWRPRDCVGQSKLAGATADLGIPTMTPAEAAHAGARSMIIGVANSGGFIPKDWLPLMTSALEAGLDVAAGLHDRLNDIAILCETARRHGRVLHDIRHPQPGSCPIATGVTRSGKRLLTVGTDCSVGKMFTSLAIERELRKRGVSADFRATGQTGIFIAGSGVAVDAVVSDFVAGAAETLSPANDPDHWDIIEGQGSVFHPAYAGVTVGLIHGSQPDALVLCHDASRTRMDDFTHYDVPDLSDCCELSLSIARRTNRAAKFHGIALNTSKLSTDTARALLRETEIRHSLPCCDPVRFGVAPIVDRLLAQLC